MKLRSVLWIIGCLVTFILIAPATADRDQGLTLVDEGVPSAVVVIPTPERLDEDRLPGWRVPGESARVLVENLEQMSGAKLEIYRDNQIGKVQLKEGKIVAENVDAEHFILIGKSDLTNLLGIEDDDLGPGGIVIKTTPNALVLMGRFNNEPGAVGGTLYATTKLLEELGFRYLWPGELGKVVPKSETVIVPEMDVRYTPPIEQRGIRVAWMDDRTIRGVTRLGFDKEDYERLYRQAMKTQAYTHRRGMSGWYYWHGLGGDAGIRGGHAFGRLYDEHFETNPGWFALQPDGTRKQTSSNRARLDVSNRELIDFIAQQIIERVNADPSLKSVSLAPNDGGQDMWDMSEVNALGEPGSAALDPPNSPKLKVPIGNVTHSLTDRYVWFWNQIAERVTKVHPDLMFTVDAYSVYSEPPVERQLHPNMVVRFTASLWSPEHRQWWNKWSEMARNIYWRPNNLYGPCREAVVEFNREYPEAMKFARDHGTVATDVDSILHYWSTQGLNYYVLARVIWDPDSDVDAIIDDYCQTGFGQAAEPIREYWRRIEELTKERYKRLRHIVFDARDEQVLHYRLDATAEVFTEPVVEELRQLLEIAAKAAKDPMVELRVEFLRTGLEFTDLQARVLRMAVDHKQGKNIDLDEAARLLDRRRTMLRYIFENWPLAVNAGYVEYMTEGAFRPLAKAVKEHQNP